MSITVSSVPHDLIWIGYLGVMLALYGCISAPWTPVPQEKVDQVQVAGMAGVRTYFGERDSAFQKDIEQSVRQELPGMFRRDLEKGVFDYSVLSLSGGGANGAFGAGFLCGWSQSGKRPRFKLVTGVSTGALIAPLAFLGSEYDEQLKAYYTTMQAKDIIEPRFLGGFYSKDSLAHSKPLAQIIAQGADQTLLKKVVQAHSQGRRLYIGTTNLDSQRFVVWNMGLIASSNHPGALKLFRDVILASASIPVVFPPVYIPVEADGQAYDEMHVDGATRTQFFFHGAVLDLMRIMKTEIGDPAKIQSAGQLYIICNGKLGPEPASVERKLSAIARRAVGTLIKTASANDLYRVYAFTKRDKIGFNYASIPEDHQKISDKPFDREEMQRLFDIGYQMGISGRNWSRVPPGLATDMPSP